MSRVHFLNVKPGDCTIIQHESGRASMIDICCGNLNPEASKSVAEFAKQSVRGNFQMCQQPTCPIDYLHSVGITSLFRFILTHPDMDHLDGFDALVRSVPTYNYWDSSVRRPKPEFGKGSPYYEADWDSYERVSNGGTDTNVMRVQAGAQFQYANKREDGGSGGDGLHILAPNKDLAAAATSEGDLNDGSYVLLYHSPGGKIIVPGDAHDNTWNYVIEHYKDIITNCSVLIAPHHGRGSGRSYDFLDIIQPKLTLFGCAPSEHLDYDAWNRRDLLKITSNQAGNIELNCNATGIEVWLENERFAAAVLETQPQKNSRGYSLLLTI